MYAAHASYSPIRRGDKHERGEPFDLLFREFFYAARCAMIPIRLSISIPVVVPIHTGDGMNSLQAATVASWFYLPSRR